MPSLKHLQLGSITYDFDATTFDSKTYNQVKADIINAVDTAQFIVSTSASDTPNTTFLYDVKSGTTIQGNLVPSNADKNNIYLVLKNASPAYYEEYIVTIQNGALSWIKFGNTNVNLAEYAKKGPYNTSSSGSGSANGTASVKYYKAQTKTGSTKGGVIDVTKDGASSVTASFKGTSITFSPTATLNGYNPTLTVTQPATTITFATGSTTKTGGSHDHSLKTHAHDATTVIKSITFTPSSLSKSTLSVVGSIKTETGSFLQGSVIGDTLKLTGVSAITSITPTNSTVVSAITFTASTLSSTTTNVASTAFEKTLTTTTTGTHSHDLFTEELQPITSVSINPGNPTISVSSITYTPAGDISVTVIPHSHQYTAPTDHTHTIDYSTETATGSATVTISSHTHTVTL